MGRVTYRLKAWDSLGRRLLLDIPKLFTAHMADIELH